MKKPTLVGMLVLAGLLTVEVLRSDPAKKEDGGSPLFSVPAEALPWEGKVKHTSSMCQGNVISLGLHVTADEQAKEILRSDLVGFLINAVNGREQWKGEEHLRVRDFAGYCLAAVDDDFQFSIAIGSLPHERDVEIREKLLRVMKK